MTGFKKGTCAKNSTGLQNSMHSQFLRRAHVLSNGLQNSMHDGNLHSAQAIIHSIQHGGCFLKLQNIKKYFVYYRS